VARRRSIARLAAAAAVTATAVWLAARNANVAGLRSALARAEFAWVLPYPIICVVLNIIRGLIWRRLLERRVTSAQAFWAYSVGFLANNVLPFRLGEAIRVVVLSTRSELPVVEVAAAAGLERLLDMASLALMLAMVGPAVARVPGLTSSAVLIVAVVAAALAVIAALARFRDAPPSVLERATRRLPPAARGAIIGRWLDLARGLAVLLKPSVGVPAAAGAVVVWTLTVALQWLVLRAFQPEAGAADAAFMVAAVSLAIALPAAPGFIGVYHWAGQQSLIAAFPERYDPNMALAAVTVSHALSFMTSTAIGIGGLWYFGMPPSALAHVVRDGRIEKAS
jgi:uncharacterized membrane protein YbhN (UPF0104 family)